MPSMLGFISILALTLWLLSRETQRVANLPTFLGMSTIGIQSSTGNMMSYLVRSLFVACTLYVFESL